MKLCMALLYFIYLYYILAGTCCEVVGINKYATANKGDLG